MMRSHWLSVLVGIILSLGLVAGLAGPVWPAQATPVLTVAPTAGPPGMIVRLRATGLEPATTYLVQLVSGRGNLNTVRLDESTATTDAGGLLTGALIVQQPPGAYTVRVVALGGAVIASAPLTITGDGGDTPLGLPRTGAGGSAVGSTLIGPPLAGLALAGLLAFTGVARRRERHD